MPGRDDLRRRTPAVVAISLERRRVCRWLLLPAAQLVVPSVAWANVARIASARMWPAQEYTRVVLEAPVSLAHQVSTLKDPHRVVLELEGVRLTPELAQLPTRVQASDPYIAAIRFGTRAPETLRVVFDLKTETRTQLFVLKPVAEFGYRVVLDLYPLTPLDPLMALLEEKREATGADPKPGAPGADAAPPKPGPTRDRRDGAGSPSRSIPGTAARIPARSVAAARYEKDVTLAIGRKLKRLIDAEPGMRAMLTRDDDYYVPLARPRAEGAPRARPISSSPSTPTHSARRGRAARRCSRCPRAARPARRRSGSRSRENAADLIGGVNLDGKDPALARTLLDLSQTAQISDSLKVGRHMLDSIGTINALHKGAVEQAGFAVLKAPDIPSVLVETAFISNPDEELKLRSDRHQAKFAESMGDGIRRYFAANPPLARAKT